MESEKKQGNGDKEVDASHRPLDRIREEAERAHIISVLQLTGGNRGKAAQMLGISRKTLWKKTKILGIPRRPAT
ncbi:MAG: helix-turn-helix domain-containing protein [Acidobacteriota bacterium]